MIDDVPSPHRVRPKIPLLMCVAGNPETDTVVGMCCDMFMGVVIICNYVHYYLQLPHPSSRGSG